MGCQIFDTVRTDEAHPENNLMLLPSEDATFISFYYYVASVIQVSEPHCYVATQWCTRHESPDTSRQR